jgi:hypothetical protein
VREGIRKGEVLREEERNKGEETEGVREGPSRRVRFSLMARPRHQDICMM